MGIFDWLFGGCCSSSAQCASAFLDGVEEVMHIMDLMRDGLDKAEAIAQTAEEYGATVAEIAEFFADDEVRSEAKQYMN